MSDDDPFDGKRFSEKPFEPKENAQHRHMMNSVSDVWPSLLAIAQIAVAAKKIAAIIAVLGGLGAAIAWLMQSGLIG